MLTGARRWLAFHLAQARMIREAERDGGRDLTPGRLDAITALARQKAAQRFPAPPGR